MFVENGTLPVGVIYQGRRCSAYTFRPMRVRDSIEARKSPDFARCKGDDELMGLLSYAARLSIEGVPREAMTLDFMLDLFDEDMDEILAADGRLKEQMARFRGQGTKAVGAIPGEDRDAVENGGEDAAGKSHGVDGGVGGPEQPEAEEARKEV